MAVQKFTQNSDRLYHSEAVSNGATSTPLLLQGGNPNIEQFLACVACTTTNKVQYTPDPVEDVDDGSANWFDWEAGEVTANTGKTIPKQAVAVRCVNSGASASTFIVTGK